MPSMVIKESYNHFLRSRGSTRTKVYNGNNLILGTSSHSNYSPLGIFYFTSLDWRGYQSQARITLSSIPDNAIITGVTGSFYLRVDGTGAQDCVLEMYEYDWGSTVSTDDWRSIAALQSLYSANKRLASDDSAGMSVGWNDFVMDETNFITSLQAALDAGDTYWNFIYVSDDNRFGTNTGTNDVTLEIGDAVVPEFTIDYIVPEPHTLNLGTVF